MANNLLVNNVYYTAEQYVDPVQYSTPQNALVDNKLIYPLLQDAGNFQVAVAKAEIPLDTIPLTKYNIPLKRYEVILRQGANEASAYLRQLNASTKDFLWNCSPAGIVDLYYYTTTGTLTQAGSTDCSAFVPNGVSFFAIDDYRNAYFATADIVGGLVNTIIVVNLTTSTLLTTLTATLIQGMDLDRGNKLYIADEEVGGSVVKVYSNQNSATEVNLNLIETITLDYEGNPLVSIRTICADQTLLVGYDVNKFSIYNITTFVPYTGFTNASITHMGRASALNSSGQGTFVVVDDGAVDDLFVGVKSPSTSPNLYNMTTNQLFGEGGTWLIDSKIALTTNGYGIGVGTDNKLYVFDYNPATGQPTPGVSLVNASLPAIYTSCACADTRDNVMISSTSKSLFGGNIDNTTHSNVLPIDTEFKLGSVTPKSWDYQASSKKILAIKASDGTLYITDKPIYGKYFLNLQSLSPTSTTFGLQLFGAGWNVKNTQAQTATQIQFPSSGVTELFIRDAYQQSNGHIVMLVSTFLPDLTMVYMIRVMDVNGNLINTFNVDSIHPMNAICNPFSGYVACMNTNGDIYIYSEASIGSPIPVATINTGFVSSGTAFTFITGTRAVGGSPNVIAVTFGTTLAIYTASVVGTWTQSFASNSITPVNGSVKYTNYFMDCVFYGAGTATPILYAIASGSKASPSFGDCQALVQFAFDATFENLAEAIIQIDNQTFCGLSGTLSANYLQNEIYVQNGTNFENPSGTILVWNTEYNETTSTITIPNRSTVFNPLISLVLTGDSDYYTWQQINAPTTGFLSVACSRRNPNNIYVLSNAGVPYKGTLVGTSIPFAFFTAIPTDVNWTSISLAPDATTYDSYVYEYTISSQTQVGASQHYQGLLVPAVARNDVAGNYSVSIKNTQVDFFNALNFTKTGTALLPSANLIYTKAGEDVDAGYADIYNFQVFLDALNAAFAEAYARLKNSGGSLAEAPVASIDFTTQLFTLNYSSDYPQTGNGIIFNPALLRIVQYYATPDKTDVGFFKLVLPPSSTSWTQTNKSAYRFNKLNKVLFQSTTIYVSGSFVGINAQNQTITDVDVPTDSFIDNLGQTLYFQPNQLRPYILGSNNPIDRVQLAILYSYIDGSQYTLTIAPDDGWSVLFDFIRRV